MLTYCRVLFTARLAAGSMLTYSLPKLSGFITLPPGTAGCRSAGIMADEPNRLVGSISCKLRETIIRFDMGKFVQCYYWCEPSTLFFGVLKELTHPFPVDSTSRGTKTRQAIASTGSFTSPWRRTAWPSERRSVGGASSRTTG